MLSSKYRLGWVLGRTEKRDRNGGFAGDNCNHLEMGYI